MSKSSAFKISLMWALHSFLHQFYFSVCSAGTCFAFDGLEYPDNRVCPGSSACCGYNATCLPNRLCHNNGDPDTTLVRGPCALNPWDINLCAQICLYNESDSGNLFPRVFVCQDGSLCCDDDRQCCQSSRGVFLDNHGNILTASPTSSSSITSSTSILLSSIVSATSSAAITPFITSTTAPQQTSDNSSSQSLSTGAKAGLGVAIPLGIAIIASIVAIAYYLRRRAWSKSSPDRVEMTPRTELLEPELICENSGPKPSANPFEWEARHETIRYEMPAGMMSPRELHSPLKPKDA